MKKNEERSDNRKKKHMMKRNISRLGGSGLSLEAFANAKSKSKQYNPALISKLLSRFYSLNFFLILSTLVLFYLCTRIAISFHEYSALSRRN